MITTVICINDNNWLNMAVQYWHRMVHFTLLDFKKDKLFFVYGFMCKFSLLIRSSSKIFFMNYVKKTKYAIPRFSSSISVIIWSWNITLSKLCNSFCFKKLLALHKPLYSTHRDITISFLFVASSFELKLMWYIRNAHSSTYIVLTW